MKHGKQTGTNQERRIKTILEEITPDFVKAGARRIRHEDVQQAASQNEEFRSLVKGDGPLARFDKDLHTMFDMIRSHAAGQDLDTPYWTIAVAAFTLQYVTKAIDIIPDQLPVIGQLDDAIVVAHGIDLIRDELHAYGIRNRARKLSEETGAR